MEDQVEYRSVPDYPGYEVGDDGSVWSYWEKRWFKGLGKTGCEAYISEQRHQLKPVIDKNYGYCIVTLRKGDKRYNVKVHLLVLRAFKGPQPKGAIGLHYPSRNKQNNAVENLIWGTHKLNAEHRDEHGTTSRGENSPNTELKDADVKNMHFLRSIGLLHREIAEIYGLARTTVSGILAGNNWKHIKP